MKTGHPRSSPNFASRLLLLTIGLLAAAATSSFAQQQAAAKLPEFEVASIRLSGEGQRELNGFYTYPGGRIIGKGCRLEYLVMLAFDVQEFQISGGPKWIDDTRFDIQAKPPASSPSLQSDPSSPKNAPSDEQRQMLRALLIDRFQLKFHRASREGSVYILEKGDKDLKLQAPKDKNEFPWAGAVSGGWFLGGIRGDNISMPQLSARLSRFLERPVLDRTGLQGSFDFEYRTVDADTDSNIPGFLFTAMKGLGLKLTAGKGPVETILIDHAENPSEN